MDRSFRHDRAPRLLAWPRHVEVPKVNDACQCIGVCRQVYSQLLGFPRACRYSPVSLCVGGSAGHGFARLPPLGSAAARARLACRLRYRGRPVRAGCPVDRRARQCPRLGRRRSPGAQGCVDRKRGRIDRRELIRGEWRGDACIRARPYGVRRGDGSVARVLVVVHEHAMAFLFPPGRR